MVARALLVAALCLPALAVAGRVDVWALRDAVSRVEALTPTVNPERCWSEGDQAAEPLRPAQKQAIERAGRACEQEAARQQALFDAATKDFNAKWRPLLLNAIQRGDLVAEVIWRQCDITPVLDRRGLASTCEFMGTPQREAAARRLREIGFVPAFDWAVEALRSHGPKPALVLQQLTERMAGGDFSGDLYVGSGLGAVAQSDGDVEEIRWRRVLAAAMAEARQAFALRDQYAGPPMRLNRHRENRLAELTRGPEVRAIGGDYFERLRDMRRIGASVALQYVSPDHPLANTWETIGGVGDPVFLRALRDVMGRADASVQSWLQQDARWSVFLLQRMAWHDWLPAQTPDERARLDPSWDGEWRLDAVFSDLHREAFLPARARISRDTRGSWLQFEAEAGPSCRLRYSGGVLGPPYDLLLSNGERQRLLRARTATPGDPPALSDPGVLAPLIGGKAYKQVLVQCPQGEWPDSTRVHYLFLADDVMVEMVRESDEVPPSRVRHWRRAPQRPHGWPAPTEAPPLDTAALLAELDAAIGIAEWVRQAPQQQTPPAWVDVLARWRLTGWPFDENADPDDGVQRQIRGRSNAAALCGRLAQRPADPMVRFNIVQALRHDAMELLLAMPRRERLAACLRPSLADAHRWVQGEALLALGFLAMPEDEERLKRFAGDADPALAAQAREALFRFDAAKRR